MYSRPDVPHPGEAGFWDLFHSQKPVVIEEVAPELVVVPRQQRRESSLPLCSILIGVAVFLLLMWLLQGGTSTVYMGWWSSGKKAHIESAKPPASPPSLAETLQESVSKHSNVNHLTASTDKEKNSEAVLEFLQTNPRSMVVVFAPWCSHCTSAVPLIASGADKIQHPVGFIDATQVPPDLISGPGSAIKVAHFPFVASHTNGSFAVFNDRLTMDNLKAFADSQ